MQVTLWHNMASVMHSEHAVRQSIHATGGLCVHMSCQCALTAFLSSDAKQHMQNLYFDCVCYLPCTMFLSGLSVSANWLNISIFGVELAAFSPTHSMMSLFRQDLRFKQSKMPFSHLGLFSLSQLFAESLSVTRTLLGETIQLSFFPSLKSYIFRILAHQIPEFGR